MFLYVILSNKYREKLKLLVPKEQPPRKLSGLKGPILIVNSGERQINARRRDNDLRQMNRGGTAGILFISSSETCAGLKNYREN